MLGLSPQNVSGLAQAWQSCLKTALAQGPALALGRALAIQLLEKILNFPFATAAASQRSGLLGNLLHAHASEIQPAYLSTLGAAAKAQRFVVGIIGYTHAISLKSVIDILVRNISDKSYFTPAFHASSAPHILATSLAGHRA